ncbi:ciliary microtubule inner protein 4 isoform X2 [Tiliqua scincoides]|uniref:ciliary microtubule inner protein 4 isoform X2 n=1 Tax=Tiliqua scincoides TaxID=71010 RepID=UPI003462AF90
MEEVPMDMTFTVPASTYFETRVANCPPVPGHVNKQQATFNMAGAQVKEKRSSSKSSNGTPCKNAKSQTENKATDFPSVMPRQPFHTRNNSRPALCTTPKMPSAQCIHPESRNDSPESTISKGTGNHQKGRPGSFQLLAKSNLEEMEDGYTDSDEPMSRQYRPLGHRLTASPRKTIKGSCEDITRFQDVSSAKESLVSSGQDVKAEGKLVPEKQSSLIPTNIKAKYGTTVVEKLVTEEQARRTLCEAGLIQGQKRLSDKFQSLENPMASSPYADYYELGYNLRSNIFQGGPLESKSLMKDSYTPDVVKRATRDPKHWHGRKTDDLGRWFQKNALNHNLQKALDEKYGERKGGKS